MISISKFWIQNLLVLKPLQLFEFTQTRFNEIRWVPKCATQLWYIFGCSKETNLSRLLTILLRLSMIKPINNENYQKSELGSELGTS